MACLFLFRRTWPRAPNWAWVLFGFSPVLGFLLFKLYADTWILLGGLLLLLAIQRNLKWAIILASAFLIGIKREGFLQIFVLSLTWMLLMHGRTRWRALWALGFGALFFALYALYVKYVAPPVPGDLEIGNQFAELRTYTHKIPRIFGYYLDVLFRLNHWIVLWPVVFWKLWKKGGTVGWASIPMFLFLLLMPLGFLIYPESVYREVVLSGTFRPLVHVLPTAWLLLRASISTHEESGPCSDSGLSAGGHAA